MSYLVIPFFAAPLPNLLGRGCGEDDILSMDSDGGSDLGYFLTSCFIVSGFGLVGVMAHVNVIQVPAMVLSLLSGLCVYGTIVGYIHYFSQSSDSIY